MSAEGPHRSRIGDAGQTGWRVVRREGSVTDLERPRVVSGAGLLLLFPIPIGLAITAWLLGLRFMLPLGALAIVVAMLWPLRHERLRISADRVTWRDRVGGARFRASLGNTQIVARRAGRERALVLTDGSAEHLLATSTAEDIDALAQLLDEALARARHSESADRTPRG